MKQRGQSGIEYLAVYVIAFMIVLVVIASIWYVFYSRPTVTPHCDFTTDFYCSDDYITPDGNLTLRIKQSTGHPINITGFNCTKEENAVMLLAVLNPAVSIDNGEEAVVVSNTPCYRTGSNAASGTTGEYFSGNIFINYTETDTGMNQILQGKIVVRYE